MAERLPLVVARTVSAVDRAAVVTGAIAGSARVLFCADLPSMVAALRRDRVGIVVLELDLDSADDLGLLLDAISQQTAPVPVILRFGLSRRPMRQAVQCACRLRQVLVSIRGGFNDLSMDIRHVLSGKAPDRAGIDIIARLAPAVSSEVRDFVGWAAILGERDTPVVELARTCNCSVRVLQDRFAAAGLMSPKQLLMRMLVLHTTYQWQRLGWDAKHRAARAGLQSREALRKRVGRVTGTCITDLKHERSFADELARLADELCSRRDGVRSP